LTSWNSAITRAGDRKSLAALVNDYLATWSPAELARLPAQCRPDRIRGVEDIGYWRQVLSDSYCSGGVHEAASDILSRLIGFLTSAAERLAELDAEDGIDASGDSQHAMAAARDNQAQGD
jgi:hypothetical protein